MSEIRYRMLCTTLTILPEGGSLLDDVSTAVSMTDAGGGAYVTVTQVRDATHTLLIDPQEWPHIRDAVDRMLGWVEDLEQSCVKQAPEVSSLVACDLRQEELRPREIRK